MGTTSSVKQRPEEIHFSADAEKRQKTTVYSSRKTNNEIERSIARDRRKEKGTMKILCLGTSCSGKSTILKQMKIIHLGGFADDQQEIYSDSFLFTFVVSANELLSKLPSYACDLKTQEVIQKITDLTNVPAQAIKHDQDVFTKVLPFFRSYQGTEILSKYGHGEQCGAFLVYFLDRMDTVSTYKKFIPNTKDILRIRVQTTGVVFTKFRYKKTNFCMVDVGGQKTERRKWIHLFDDVKAIFFVVDLSNFVGMNESLDVFTSICTTKALIDASVILFFNKADIFQEKRNLWELAKHFSDFISTPCNHRSTGLFIKKKFEDRFRKHHEKGSIYSFFTCATDTQNIDRTFAACSDIILKRSLTAAGLY